MLSDVGRLRTLSRIAEHGSFSRAADELGYTQSAISQQIAALKQEVQLTLLNRSVRPIALADAGRVLVDHTEPILRQIAAAEAQLDALRGLRAGRLRAAAFGSAFATFLPAVIADFRRRHPSVVLDVVEAEPDRSLAMLRTGEIDLALVYGFTDDLENANRRFAATRLLTDEHRAVLPARHRLATRKTLSIADLADEEWIVPYGDGPARGYRGELERLCATPGSHRGSRSRPTTCRPRRPSSPPASASRSCTTSRCLAARRRRDPAAHRASPRTPHQRRHRQRSPVTAGDGDDGDPGCVAGAAERHPGRSMTTAWWR